MDVAVIDDYDNCDDEEEEQDGVDEEHDERLSRRGGFIIVMVGRARRHYFNTGIQFFDFSPLCCLKCVLKWSAQEEDNVTTIDYEDVGGVFVNYDDEEEEKE